MEVAVVYSCLLVKAQLVEQSISLLVLVFPVQQG
jgi:hypothetical protein